MPSVSRLHILLVVGLFAIGAGLGCRRSSESEAGGGHPTAAGRLAATSASRNARSLSIGDPAPPLSIAHWVTGEPVPRLAAGQIYVVEFWASWCPPCLANMPHLNQLQQQYGDGVQLIGVTSETEREVRDFLAKSQANNGTSAEVVTYRLATDEAGATYAAYMEASGQSGIPTAFIVGADGRVEWIGHPIMMDEPLARIVAGDWDHAAAITRSEQEEMLEEISGELDELLRSRQWDIALARLDRFEADWGASSVTSKRRLSILHRAGRTEATSTVRAELTDLLWDNAAALNEIAWEIATEGGDSDLNLAFKAARRAAELSKHQDAAILDTLARVHYAQGELDEAIRWQRKAVEHNRGRPEIEDVLSVYEAEKAAQSAVSDSSGEDDAT